MVMVQFMSSSCAVTCDPPCVNGVCIENNVCTCNEGFQGDRCSVPSKKSNYESESFLDSLLVLLEVIIFMLLRPNSIVMEDCEVNFCANNATCTKQVLSYLCECPQGFIGDLCEKKGKPDQLYYRGGGQPTGV